MSSACNLPTVPLTSDRFRELADRLAELESAVAAVTGDTVHFCRMAAWAALFDDAVDLLAAECAIGRDVLEAPLFASMPPCALGSSCVCQG